MEFTISGHARDQLTDREITEAQARLAVDEPDYTTKNTFNRPGKKYFKHFGERLLCVVIAQGNNGYTGYVLVTAIWKGEDDG